MTRWNSSRAALAVAAALLATLAFAAPAFAGGWMPTTDIPLDGTDMLKNMPVPKQISTELLSLGSLDPNDYTHNGTSATIVLTLGDMSSDPKGPHVVPFWREASGDHSDIYVAWDDLEAPAESVQQYQTITRADIDYMSAEFDSRIWKSDVFHFGNYDARPAGTDEGKRAGIFIYNIRDDAYWSDYRFYIAGYFSSGLNDEIDLNAIFIDSYDWPHRTRGTSARPYLYEGTIAHEFQHLIHHDVDGDEDSFVDEGMADLAEQFIYGTTTTSSHIGEYLVYHRDSLIDWKGELYDYGNAVLWTDYLFERMGGGSLAPVDPADPLAGRVTAAYIGGDKEFSNTPDKFVDDGDRFIWNLVHDPANGLAGVADQVGGGMAHVEQLHHDYTLANLLDGKVIEPRYNYANLELGGADSYGYSIDDGIDYYNAKVRGNVPPTRKNVWRRAATEAWGAYYRTFQGSEPGYAFTFTGEATSGVPAYSLPTEWYSGLGNMLDRTLTRTINVPPGSELSFMTWFDIEPDWDYGYVQASADGVNWQTLTQLSSLRTGVTDINLSSAWKVGGAGGFTGSSGGWKLARFSLGSLSGDVHFRFRYVTDEAANGTGWYVDDIAVGSFTDPVDSTNGWATDAANGWLFTSGLQDNDWTVDLWVPFAKGRTSCRELVPLVGVDGQGLNGQTAVDTQWVKDGRIYAVISNRPTGPFLANSRLTVLKNR